MRSGNIDHTRRKPWSNNYIHHVCTKLVYHTHLCNNSTNARLTNMNWRLLFELFEMKSFEWIVHHFFCYQFIWYPCYRVIVWGTQVPNNTKFNRNHLVATYLRAPLYWELCNMKFMRSLNLTLWAIFSFRKKGEYLLVYCLIVNMLRPKQNGHPFADETLKVPCSNLAIKWQSRIFKSSENYRIQYLHTPSISSHQVKPISQNMYLIVLTPTRRYTSRIRPIFSNQFWETPNNDVMTELCACPLWEFQQHASRTIPTLSIDQSLSISHCQCISNSHHNLMINHYCPKK